MKKMFTLLLLAALLAMPQPALAVPALEHTVTRTQPDGSVVTLKQHGDEFAHWLEDTAGHAVVKTKEGRFEFALPDGAGGLKASGKPDAAHDGEKIERAVVSLSRMVGAEGSLHRLALTGCRRR